jgi:hypothetical protein
LAPTVINLQSAIRNFLGLIAERHWEPSNEVLARFSVYKESKPMKMITRKVCFRWKASLRKVAGRSGMRKRVRFFMGMALQTASGTNPAECVAGHS